uniref:Uncharacterized protein n=1 Tax=Planktothrix pseudagardhii TaxID=132604 RepID=A0A9W4G5Z0_9CYAN|nr:hypothetical protein NO713_02452 [Planktothrix pseudagardhii]
MPNTLNLDYNTISRLFLSVLANKSGFPLAESREKN